MRTLTLNSFGHLEIAILEIFWTQAGSMTVRQVLAALHERERALAYTTVLTTMVRLQEKGWLSRADGRRMNRGRVGRGHVDMYTCVVSRGALLAATIAEACERLHVDASARTEVLQLLGTRG